ncbi:MAG: replication initiator protein [Microviridae sp.]|nr:MAG: replication initiator protein [Microviridae sp.]
MSCYSPNQGYKSRFKTKSGKYPLTFDRDKASVIKPEFLTVPCGKCVGCCLARGKDWSLRSVHEAKYHDQSSFLTLTYNTKGLPSVVSDDGDVLGSGTLRPRDVTLFIKRLRKSMEGTSVRIKYYAAGEYGGGRTKRPHYHLLVFGWMPDDLVFHKYGSNGDPIYTSATLASFWYDEDTRENLGFSSVSHLNARSAGYVAQYSLKKVTDRNNPERYVRFNPLAGEFNVYPEFSRCSQGIGLEWYKANFLSDAFVKGFVTHNGVKYRIPRYYLKRFEIEYPAEFAFFQLLKKDSVRLLYSSKRPIDYLADRERLLEVHSKLKREVNFDEYDIG